MRKAMLVVALTAAFAVGVVGAALAHLDFGLQEQQFLAANSQPLFGVAKPLEASSQTDLEAPIADPLSLVTLAKHLSARVVSTPAEADNVDMIALWPNDVNPTYLIACNEADPEDPGLIRINIATGAWETILSGTQDCDPAHVTPWGTVVFGEENGTDGRFWELIDPLNTTDVALVNGVPSGGTNPDNIVERPALGHLSFEGIGVLPSGVVYYGDENRPDQGTPGGPYFKFIPDTLRTDTDPIDDLSDSPLVDGSVYGMRLGLRENDDDVPNADYGQGTQTGRGIWIPANVDPFPDLRAVAADLKLTGYYRPEDLSIDPVELAEDNVRFCGNDTGNEGTDANYGETICVTDGTLDEAGTPDSTPEVQFFVLGNPELAMMDNIAYQSGRGNWVLHEDGDQVLGNNDLWDCLPDGADDNLLSDGCIRVGTLNDLDAEWTGGVFDASGTHFFVSVQHSDTDTGVVLEITGWK